MGQKGAEAEAVQAWQSLIDDSAPQAPWVPFAKSQIEALNQRMASSDDNAQSPAMEGTQGPGPTREDMEAASEMSAEDRQQMIENMVSQLADRLNEQGGSSDEWVRLIRAEAVLNRPDMAAKSVAKAMEALQSDIEGLEKVKAAAQSLGVSVTQ